MRNRIFNLALSLLVLAGFFAAIPVESIDELTSRFEAYTKEYPQVRVHLIFNQPKYAPGDTAFFKAYFLTEDFKPIPDKQILTLELKDEKGNNIQVQNFKVVDGEGNNQVVFGSDIIPGRYSVTVYSEWMKNFDPALYYRKDFIIAGRNQIALKKPTADTLSFHPEGGQLIEGVENRVIVKSNKKGSGKIIDQTGRLVVDFVIGSSGVAEIFFTPDKGNSYTGMLNNGNKEFPLEATKDGCALQVISNQPGTVEISISVSPTSPLRKQQVYLLALSKSRIIYSTELEFNDNQAKTFVSTLHPGLNQFYVFDKKDNVIAERVYYVEPSTVNVALTANEDVIAPRGLVDLEVSIMEESGRNLRGSFVTRALSSPLFAATSLLSFSTELNIMNDLPSMRRDFENSGLTEAEWMSSLDAQLTTQAWKRINWQEVLNPAKDRIKYPFKYSLDLKGKGYFKASGDPIPDSTLVMIYQQKAMVGYEGYSANKGQIVFPFLYDFTGTDQMFYMMEFRKKEKQSDYILEPEVIISSKNETISAETEQSDPYGEYKLKKNVIDKSFTFFTEPDKEIDDKIANPNIEFEDELGGADVNIKVDEFLVFPTMSDLIHEVIGGLQTRSGGTSGKPTVRVIFIRNTYTVIPKGDPLYIIDGIFTKNTDFFLSLNPEDIYTIKLVNNESKLQRFGGLGKYGIVLVQTKKSVAKQVIESSTMFPVSGLSQELEFKVPFYSGVASSRKPDLRASIYWSPKVSTSTNGKARVKFYASDDAAPILIEVFGFTSDGRFFSAQKTIGVKAPEIRP